MLANTASSDGIRGFHSETRFLFTEGRYVSFIQILLYFLVYHKE